MANNMLSYTSRDFESIKKDLINAIPTLTEIWTNREDSDPGMVLLTLIAALGDNLSYNMDRQSLEFFGQTVTQRKNAARVFDLVSYKMHWYESAELEITIYNNTDSQISLLFNPTGRNSQRLVSNIIGGAPAYFILYPNETPSNWNDNKVISIPSKNYAKFKAIQGDLNSVSFPSTAIDANNRYYLPVSKIDQNHMWLSDDKNYQWYLVNSINELTETVPRFEFNVDEYNLPYIQFVPYWKSSFGELHNFTLYYLSTRGASGGVTSNILNLIPSLKGINGSNDPSFNDRIIIMHNSNVYNSADINNVVGKDPQTAEEAYVDSRRYIGTYNTLVTLIDFENFMNRIPIISGAKAVDGQYATEVNEKLLETLKNKYRNVEGGSDKALALYDANKLVFENYTPTDANNDGNIDNDDSVIEHFGFEPYSLQMHMISGNFQLKDQYNQTLLATETAVKVNNQIYNEALTTTDNIKHHPIIQDSISVNIPDQESPTVSYNNNLAEFDYNGYNVSINLLNGEVLCATGITSSDNITISYKYTNLDGYIDYMLYDSVVGTSDDSTVSQSGIDKYKLFTADISYAPIRKFPFFVNGKIYLKEPLRPAEANLVLYNVYQALVTKFSAENLTIGEKINFKDILDTINNADENIYYFDAGANSETGSLVEYPTENDFNYATFNFETLSYDNYGVTINPDYFNEVSMQAYGDVIQNNNVLMYFCNTFSNRLTIADESISNKDNPPVNNVSLDAFITIPDDDNYTTFNADLKIYTLNSDGSLGNLIIDGAKVFRYVVLKEVTVDYTNPEDPMWSTNIIDSETMYYDMSKISDSDMSSGSSNINNWSFSNNFDIYKDKRTTRYLKKADGTIEVDSSFNNGLYFECVVAETISTNESKPIYCIKLVSLD